MILSPSSLTSCRSGHGRNILGQKKSHSVWKTLTQVAPTLGKWVGKCGHTVGPQGNTLWMNEWMVHVLGIFLINWYLLFLFADEKKKTKKVDNELNPFWNEVTSYFFLTLFQWLSYIWLSYLRSKVNFSLWKKNLGIVPPPLHLPLRPWRQQNRSRRRTTRMSPVWLCGERRLDREWEGWVRTWSSLELAEWRWSSYVACWRHICRAGGGN